MTSVVASRLLHTHDVLAQNSDLCTRAQCSRLRLAAPVVKISFAYTRTRLLDHLLCGRGSRRELLRSKNCPTDFPSPRRNICQVWRNVSSCVRVGIRQIWHKMLEFCGWSTRCGYATRIQPTALRTKRSYSSQRSYSSHMRAMCVCARVCEMYQARLLELKKEREEEGERRESALRSAVEAQVKEKLAEVAQAFECACCFETLGQGSVAFTPCGRSSAPSAASPWRGGWSCLAPLAT